MNNFRVRVSIVCQSLCAGGGLGDGGGANPTQGWRRIVIH